MSKFTWDIEANGLLNNDTIDYLASPYRLKDTFQMHCIVLENHETGEIVAFHDGPKYIFDGRPYEESDGKYTYVLKEYVAQDYTHFQLKDFPDFINHEGYFKDKPEYLVEMAVAHNGINYDWLATKLFYGLDYSVKYNTWGKNKVKLIDSLILSKVLNPDRKIEGKSGHSLAALSRKAGGDVKIDFRKEIPEEDRFKTFAADMLYYCIYDNKANTSVYNYLMEEWGDYDKWEGPFELEQRVADIITRQEHRGFAFNMKQAEENLAFLDAEMERLRLLVEPILPPKPATKGYLKAFIPPKLQIKKNLEPTNHMINFAKKHDGHLEERDGDWWLVMLGKEWKLPVAADEPLCDPNIPATLNDTTHIKNWLVGLGWVPSEYKDKDLTLKSGTKIKKSEEELQKGIRAYVEQTLSSNFCQDRCDHLECTPETLERKIQERIAKGKGRGLKVLTNPCFTKGQEKEICPNLQALGEKFPYATQIVEYLTYKHRRNSILGGGADWEEDEEDQEYDKGFLAAVRADGRIPTPAATCDAATSRMKHRSVANIPRVTSLFGWEMRNLFGVEVPKYFQIGYDFDSLEAKIESHYCVPMDAQALTRKGWVGYHDLKEGDEILGYNAETGLKEWTKVKGKVFYKNSKTFEIKGKSHTYRATADHRWYVNTRSKGNTYVPKVRTTAELCTGDNIICNAPFNMEQDQVNSLTSVQQGKWDVPWVERVVNMSHAERVAFLEGFLIADGYWHEHKQKPVWRWAQNPGELFEAALTASYLVHGGNISVAFNTKEQKVKVVTLANRSHIPVQSLTIEEWGVEDVWCPQTELGTWVMRQKDCITITGNCWRYEPEPHEYCNALLLEKPNDVHTMMAKRITDTIGRKFERSPAKSVKYGITYGAQADKVAKTIGSDKYTGQLVFDAFWEAAFPLARLKERLNDFWVKTGKQYVLGIDGRKVPTRSAHAILNSLFQSGGVICAKRAMVIYDDMIEEEGLSVDFFKDDWKNKDFVQQMIAYHDEAQLEVSRNLVEFKWFSPESLGWKKVDDPEEQKKIDKECLAKVEEWKHNKEKETGQIWANIHESPKGGWFTAYSRAGELAALAVTKAGEFYNLNVQLTAGYDVGNSWATCH
ncbi:MAG: DNA polymerase I [Dompiswa phage TSP7_1]|uniref:DNA polymerase/3'-5' exonuclease domain n=1 Tax=Dompiswa phage TSP7_1 TaxID=2793345 RepID=A0A7T3N5S7_9CAUD|nr:MAG: DNA polymerase I [Dompiswa phage TSP7_1]QPX72034.1 MAG: hypothetical protein [Dompiswa phage TSP7_1]